MEFRIQLKSPPKEDMQFIRWLWSDPETMEPVGGPVILSDEEADHWYKTMVDPGRPTVCYRLIFNEDKAPIGEVSFHHLDSDKMTAMFNLKIAHLERSKGYGREAMVIFLDHFFNKLGGKVMMDDISPDNHRGQEVLLRFGFERDRNVESGFMIRMTRNQFNKLYDLKRNILVESACI